MIENVFRFQIIELALTQINWLG